MSTKGTSSPVTRGLLRSVVGASSGISISFSPIGRFSPDLVWTGATDEPDGREETGGRSLACCSPDDAVFFLKMTFKLFDVFPPCELFPVVPRISPKSLPSSISC
nr:hypothetical protein Iba_chr09bCG10490 [Ipomoea batatas]